MVWSECAGDKQSPRLRSCHPEAIAGTEGGKLALRAILGGSRIAIGTRIFTLRSNRPMAFPLLQCRARLAFALSLTLSPLVAPAAPLTNTPPVVRPDEFGVLPETPATLDLLANDRDADGDALEVVSFTSPVRGSLQSLGNGRFTYTPPPGAFQFREQFSYTVTDGNGGTNSAAVLLHLGPLWSGNWSMFGREASHAGYYPGLVGTNTFFEAWTWRGTNPLQPVAVSAERVFVVSGSGTGLSTGLVAALDAGTGRSLWTRLAPSRVVSGPALEGGRLYLQSAGEPGSIFTGALTCVDGGTGTNRWVSPMSSGSGGTNLAPTPVSNLVAVAGWLNQSSGVYGFAPLDGARRFALSAGLPRNQWTPTVHEGRLYTWLAGDFSAFDPGSGTLLWTSRATLGGPNETRVFTGAATPIMEAGRAYVLANSRLVAMDVATRSFQILATNDTFAGHPAVAGGIAFAPFAGGVVAHDALTGLELGRYRTPRQEPIVGQPIVTDDSVFAGGQANTYLFERASFALRQQIPHGGALSLANGQLYIASAMTLHAYRLNVRDAINDAGISVTASPGIVRPGESFTFTLVVTNTGPEWVEGLMVTVHLPAAGERGAMEGAGFWSITDGVLTWDPEAIEGGGQSVLRIQYRAPMEADTSLAPLALAARMTHVHPDPNPLNNAASITVPVRWPTLTVTDIEVEEGNDAPVATGWNVRLLPPATNRVSVRFRDVPGSAQVNADYTPTAGELVFEPGQTNQVVPVEILGDRLNEALETFTLQLSDATNAILADAAGTCVIVDQDPEPALSIQDITLDEGNTGLTTATLVLTLSEPSGRALTLQVATTGGTATPETDFLSLAQSVAIPGGVTNETVRLLVRGDTLNELDETVQVSILQAPFVQVAKPVGTVTIRNDDPLPSIAAVSSRVMSETCEAPNNAIDPGELVGMTFVLRNIGTGLSIGPGATVTLLTTGGVAWASPSQPVAPLLVGGLPITNQFSLIATGFCGATVTARLRLEDRTNFLGDVNYPITLGALRAPGSYTCCQVDDIRLTVSDDPDPIVQGQQLTYTIGVTNAGPATATSVNVTNYLPSGVIGISATAMPGTATILGGMVTAELGTLGAGATAAVIIRGIVDIAGQLTNVTLLSRAEPDGNLANNVAVTRTHSVLPIVILEQPQPQSIMRGETARFSVGATAGSPLRYQWRWSGTNLQGATNRTLLLTDVQLAQQGRYDVVVSDDDFSRLSLPADLWVNELTSVGTAFVNLMVPPGYSMIVNPLVRRTNTVEAAFGSVPEGSSLFKIDGNGFAANNYLGGWSDPGMTLVPGEACFFKNPASETVRLTFVGFVQGGQLTVRLPAGYSAAASIVPQAGLVQDVLGFPAQAGDSIHLWHNATSDYLHYFFDGNFWFPDAPRVEVGQSFFLRKQMAAAWTRFFTVQPFGLPNTTYTLTAPSVVSEAAQVNFSTFSGGRVLDFDEVTPLHGAHRAQLYGGLTPSEEAFGPLGEPVSFSPGDFAGYVRGGTVRVPGAQGGETVYVQLRAWEAEGGPSYEAAVNSGSSKAYGRSAIVPRTAGATLQMGEPGHPPPDVNTFPTFHLVSPPRLVTGPSNQTVFLGATLRLSVAALGTGPLGYQWQYQGADLSGETNRELTYANVGPVRAGDYRVRVSNVYGVVFSLGARVEVLTPNLAVEDARVAEPDSQQSTLSFIVRLVPPSTVPVSVRYATMTNSAFNAARPGADFTTGAGLLLFPPGTDALPIVVPIHGDIRDEMHEDFLVTLTQPTNAAISRNMGVGTIIDNDPEPVLNVTSPMVSEGATGTVVMAFHFTLSEPSGRNILLSYHTTNRQAEAGSDFVPTNGFFYLRPGEVNGLLPILVKGDTLLEDDEALELRITAVGGGAMLPAVVSGIIRNDDGLPGVNLFDVRLSDVASGDGDGSPDPGETMELWVRLINTGPESLSGVTGQLFSATPGVTILTATSAYPDLAANLALTGVEPVSPYRLQVEDSVECGRRLEFVHVTEHSGGMVTNQFSLAVTNAQYWASTPVASAEGTPIDVSLAFDSAGVAYVAYYDITNRCLKVDRWDGSEWRSSVVESYSANGFEVSLALNALGQPRLCYRVDGPNSLRYAEWTGSSWTISYFGGSYGVNPSLAVDAEDQPHVVFYNMQPRGMRYARRLGNTFVVQTPDPSGEHTGYVQAIAVDRQNRPHIAYNRDSTLFHLAWSGTAWISTLVDRSIALAERPSLVLDELDQPHIACKSTIAAGFQYAYRTAAGWMREQVGATLDSGYNPSLVLDRRGRRHVVHSSISTGLLRYALWEDGVWSEQPVVYREWQTSLEFDLALSPEGRPAVA
jgi:uncharacterized repeat protein (TIGR01451 family)